MSQGSGVAGRSLWKVRLVEAQLAGGSIQPKQCDRVVLDDRGRNRNSPAVALIHRRRRSGQRTAIAWVLTTHLETGQFRNAVETRRREAHHGIDAGADFGEHHETVAAAQGARRSASIGTCRGRFGALRRVIACSDSLLDALHISQLRICRCRIVGQGVRRLVGKQFGGHLQAAVTAQGQLSAVLQSHGHRTRSAGLQLLARVQPITFDQRAAAAITADCEHFTNHLADHTD